MSTYTLKYNDYFINVTDGLRSMLATADITDVTLAVEGKYFRAHQMVLAIFSSYFKELFIANPCKHPIFFIKDVKYQIMKDLLRFMYEGVVQIPEENFNAFVDTAKALQVKGLTNVGELPCKDDTRVEASDNTKTNCAKEQTYVKDTQSDIENRSASKRPHEPSQIAHLPLPQSEQEAHVRSIAKRSKHVKQVPAPILSEVSVLPLTGSCANWKSNAQVVDEEADLMPVNVEESSIVHNTIKTSEIISDAAEMDVTGYKEKDLSEVSDLPLTRSCANWKPNTQVVDEEANLMPAGIQEPKIVRNSIERSEMISNAAEIDETEFKENVISEVSDWTPNAEVVDEEADLMPADIQEPNFVLNTVVTSEIISLVAEGDETEYKENVDTIDLESDMDECNMNPEEDYSIDILHDDGEDDDLQILDEGAVEGELVAVTFVQTRKGRSLIANNYRYCIGNQCNYWTTWRCSTYRSQKRQNCRATVCITRDKRLVFKNAHNHEASDLDPFIGALVVQPHTCKLSTMAQLIQWRCNMEQSKNNVQLLS